MVINSSAIMAATRRALAPSTPTHSRQDREQRVGGFQGRDRAHRVRGTTVLPVDVDQNTRTEPMQTVIKLYVTGALLLFLLITKKLLLLKTN